MWKFLVFAYTCAVFEVSSTENKCLKANEVYDLCPVICPFRTCGIDDRLVDCSPTLPRPGDPNCPQPACRCRDQTFRDDKGNCVPWEKCPKCTKPNEVYDPCDAPCPARRCDFNAAVVRCGTPPMIGDPLCLVGCRCIDGYLRDSRGVCIPANKCPKCTKPNQVYDMCPGCSPQTCKTKNQIYHCPMIPANKTGPNCHPACRCKPGYFKNLIGDCILASDCDKCPGNHEYFSCGVACDNVCATLSKQNQTNCPIINKKCNEMCYCEQGYARATNNTCIPIKNCKVCPAGEVYSDCPPIKCDGEYCPKNRLSPQSCPIPKKCGKGRCICGFNSHRDRRTGKCIRTSDCPPFKCEKNNEAYNSCPSACPDANCPDYLKNVTCPNPRFKELFVVACKPACRCQSGYYRDSQGNCVCAAQCKDRTAPQPTCPRVSCGDVDILQQSLEKASNTLSIKSLYQLDVATPGVSTIISVFSYFVLLAQLALYSNGQTYTELINVLNVTTKNNIRCAFPGLLKSIRVTQGAELDIGNKIYVNDKYQLSDQYKNDSVAVFNTEAEKVNFNNPTQAANTINKWVSDTTKGKITDLVSADMFDSMTRLVLTNAIYFKGIWKTEFNPNLTQSADFYVNSQKTIKVQMMKQKGIFNYAESYEIDSQVVQIPYQNDNISLVLVSPNQQDGLRTVLDKLRDTAVIHKVLSELCQEKVTIFMPKFDISSKINIIDVLKPIGVQTIFGSNAELSGMVVPDEALYVSDAVQKATVTVNEQGSEAAAASAIGVTAFTASIQPPREFIIRADRPFLYGIRFNNIFLFSGLFYG